MKTIQGVLSAARLPIRYPQALPLSDFQIGFVVGLIEGEGSITIRRGANYAPVISISNCSKELLEAAQATLGMGTIRLRNRNNPAQHRVCYVLYIESLVRAADVLHTIKDRLVSNRKKTAAELVYRYCLSRISKLLVTGRGQPPPYSQEELDLAQQVKLNNRRGPV